MPVSPHCPQEIVLLPLPPPVLQGTSISSECFIQLPPGNVAETYPERLATSKKVFITARSAVRERLLPLVHFLEVWKLLPNVPQRVLHTVERGYKIQFGSHPPLFNGVFPTLVGPEQTLVKEQEVDALFYSRYFIVPKRDGGVASYSRFEIIELFSHETQVQDAYYQGVTNQVRGLVCDDRSERRLLLYIHSFSTLEVPKVCFLGQSIPISGSSVRTSTLTPHFHEVCGCCSGSPATLGHLQTELHRRLVDSSSIRAVSSSALRWCSCSHERHVMTFGLLHIRPCGSAPQAFPRGATYFA